MRFSKSAAVTMIALALTVLGASAVTLAQEAVSEITVQGEAIAVSNISYDAASGSVVIGTAGQAQAAVYSVAADGALTPVVQDAAITAPLTLMVDGARGRLLVVNTSVPALPEGFDPASMQLPEGMTLPEGFDPANMPMPGNFDPANLPEGMTLPEGFDPSMIRQMMGSTTIGLLVYDLTTGAQTLNVDLTAVAPTGGRLPNAIALDADGNAYISDRAAGVVYRVDTAGSAAYLTDSRFTGENGVGLSGIAFQNGALLVSRSDGALFRIPLDNPANVSAVTIDAAPSAISAMTLLADGRIVTLDAQNGTLTVLTSADDWTTASASASSPAPEDASGLTSDGGTNVYVVTGGFGGGMMAGMMGGGAAGGQMADLPAPVITEIAF